MWLCRERAVRELGIARAENGVRIALDTEFGCGVTFFDGPEAPHRNLVNVSRPPSVARVGFRAFVGRIGRFNRRSCESVPDTENELNLCGLPSGING